MDDRAYRRARAALVAAGQLGLVSGAGGYALPGAVLASVAVSAYRSARRNRLELPDMAAEINEAIATQFGASQFATAVVARLDISTGRLRWINGGHPEPLIVRGPSLVRPPSCPPNRPLGLQERTPTVCETRLEPGDRLVLYTDGITEARSPGGEFFGEQRLADFISAAAAAGDPAPETVRRLMRNVLDHQAGQLQDDASIVVLEPREGGMRGERHWDGGSGWLNDARGRISIVLHVWYRQIAYADALHGLAFPEVDPPHHVEQLDARAPWLQARQRLPASVVLGSSQVAARVRDRLASASLIGSQPSSCSKIDTKLSGPSTPCAWSTRCQASKNR